MLEAGDFSEKMIEQAKLRPYSASLHFSDGFTVTDREVYGGALALTYTEVKVRDKKQKGVES